MIGALSVGWLGLSLLWGPMGCVDLPWTLLGRKTPPCHESPVPRKTAWLDVDAMARLQRVGTRCVPDRGFVTALLPIPGQQLVVGGRFSPTQIGSPHTSTWSRALDTGQGLSLAAQGDDRIVVGTNRGMLQVWSPSGRVAEIATRSGPLWAVHAPSADEVWSVGRGGCLTQWRVADQAAVRSVPTPFDCWSLGVRGDQVVLGTMEGAVSVPPPAEAVPAPVGDTPIWSAVPTARGWALGTDHALVLTDEDLAPYARVRLRGTVRSVALAPDGSFLVAGTWAGRVVVLDLDGRILARHTANQGRVQVVAVHPGQRWIAAGGDGGVVAFFGVPDAADVSSSGA